MYTPESGNDHTYFYGSNGVGSVAGGQFDLSLRLRRLNNVLHSYYKVPGGDWVEIGTSVAVSQEYQDVPIQFGFRVKKEWRAYHKFSVVKIQRSGGPPLPIPTKVPTTSPTETRTWISELPATTDNGAVCPTTLDRSSVSQYPYEVRGIGGGGAMSGLSISPWDDLWFVGTDMGTLFRSTDSGNLWYQISHSEAKYEPRLLVSMSVGYTSNPSTVLHASCHEDITNRNCVAQRSTDAGVSWSPIDITGGSKTDSHGNTVLEEIPKQFVGSLVQNSGLVYCTTFNSGKVYKSSDDGLNWSQLNLPFETGDLAVGLYLDESSSPTRYIYFATSQGIYMWKDGSEMDARQIYSTDGASSIQSFTGARTADVLMLSFVDSDVTACAIEGDVTTDCGYVHTFRQSISTLEAETADFTFTKTSQHAFRVVSSATEDACGLVRMTLIKAHSSLH